MSSRSSQLVPRIEEGDHVKFTPNASSTSLTLPPGEKDHIDWDGKPPAASGFSPPRGGSKEAASLHQYKIGARARPR